MYVDDFIAFANEDDMWSDFASRCTTHLRMDFDKLTHILGMEVDQTLAM